MSYNSCTKYYKFKMFITWFKVKMPIKPTRCVDNSLYFKFVNRPFYSNIEPDNTKLVQLNANLV